MIGGPQTEKRSCAPAHEIDVFEQRIPGGPAGWAGEVKRRARRRTRHRSRLTLNAFGFSTETEPHGDEPGSDPAKPVGKRDRRRASASGSVMVWTTQSTTRRRKRRCITRYVTCRTCHYTRKWWEPCGLPCL